MRGHPGFMVKPICKDDGTPSLPLPQEVRGVIVIVTGSTIVLDFSLLCCMVTAIHCNSVVSLLR